MSKIIKLFSMIFIVFCGYILFKNNWYLVDEINNNKESFDKITLKSDEINFSFDRKDIPEIDAYLSDNNDLKIEIERMNLLHVSTINDNNYYIIQYGCGTKLCNNILVEENKGILNTVLLSEFSIYQGLKLSPNLNYMVFIFGRNEGSIVIKHDLVIVNISDLQKQQLIVSEKEKFKSFNWMITNVEWLNDDRLQITIPSIANFDFDYLKQWIESNNQETKNIKLTIKAN